MMAAAQLRKRPNLKSIALPAEHGGWGFLLEPIILGLTAAFSTEAIGLSLAMLSVFLIHQPIKIAAKDRLKGHSAERTRWAERFVVVYGGIALVLFILLSSVSSARFLLPLGLALPLMLLQFRYDIQNKSRDLIPEISGALALGAIASSIAILDGLQTIPALALWLMMALRFVPAILYVRARLRLERGKPAAIATANIAHVLAFILSMVFLAGGAFPIVVPIGLGFLTLRSFWGLSSYRKPASRPAVIGFQELFYGLLFAFVVGIGYALQ